MIFPSRISIMRSVCSATFLSSAMRGALFAMAGGMVYLAVVGREEIKLRDWSMMLGILAGLIVLLGSVMLTHTGTGILLERLTAFSLSRGSSISRKATNLFYLGQWLNHPFIGHGPLLTLERGVGGTVTHDPHCMYIRYLYTTGLLGFSGFMLVLFKLYTYSLRAIRRTEFRDHSVRGLVTVFHVLFIVFVAHEIFDDYTAVWQYQHIIWALFAILVVLSRIVLEPEPRPFDVARRIHTRPPAWVGQGQP